MAEMSEWSEMLLFVVVQVMRRAAAIRLRRRSWRSDRRVQQDRAWDHASGGQHIRVSAGADARHIRNDQLERAWRGG